jgi:uncharacterized protein (DUF952 family)
MPIIYHITTEPEWKAAKETGFYESPSLRTEGFIHCSQEHQIAGVLQRYFSGKTNLLKLVIDTDKLSNPFIYEWSPSVADTFPHVYGRIDTVAVLEVIPL